MVANTNQKETTYSNTEQRNMPYVELKIANSIINPVKSLKSFTYKRCTYDVSNDLSLELFDYSGNELEQMLIEYAQGIGEDKTKHTVIPIEFSYGRRIEDCKGKRIYGILLGYDVNFEAGGSTSLNMQFVSTSVEQGVGVQLSFNFSNTTKDKNAKPQRPTYTMLKSNNANPVTAEIPDTVSIDGGKTSIRVAGNPAGIVAFICNQLGWTYDIEPTITIPRDFNQKGIDIAALNRMSEEARNNQVTIIKKQIDELLSKNVGVKEFNCDNKSPFLFFRELATFAMSEANLTSGYIISSKDYTDAKGKTAPRITFKPMKYNTKESNIKNLFHDLRYGAPQSEVLSFKPRYTGIIQALMGGLNTTIQAVNSNSGTTQLTTMNKNASTQSNASDPKQSTMSLNSSAIMADAVSLNPIEAQIRANYISTKSSDEMYQATLEIRGDTAFEPLEMIRITVFTRDGKPHHTSGIYMILTVTDSYDGAFFKSTLELIRNTTSWGDVPVTKTATKAETSPVKAANKSIATTSPATELEVAKKIKTEFK